jgi:cytochrome c
MAPGTRMAFSGIKDDGEIANLWAYINQFKEDGSKK